MRPIYQCTITTRLKLLDEGTLYIAALDQLARDNRGDVPDRLIELALNSPEAAITQLILRSAAFRNLEGVSRLGIPQIDVVSALTIAAEHSNES